MQVVKKYVVLLILYIGYVMHTYSRRSFQNVINYILKEQFLQPQHIGFIVTSQQIGYTMSKFTHPFIIDIPNPKWLFCTTMFTSSIILTLLSHAQTWKWLSCLYWSNGFFLAFAWPCLAKLLKQMIVEEEFGFWWALECTSSNVGAIIGSLLSTLISDRFGWRNSIRFCALVNVIAACVVTILFLFLSIPRSHSLNPSKFNPNQTRIGLWEYIFNPILMANGLSFFTIYLCRYLVSDWYQIYLSNLNFKQIIIASFISSMEFGGTIGSIVAGMLADYFYVHCYEWQNPRLFVIIICGTFVTLLQHVLIFFVNIHTSQIALSLLGFLYGFFIYGPVAVSGIIAIEAAPINKQGLTFSINVLYSNFAMLFAGFPLSFIGTHFGWKTAFIGCYILVGMSTLLVMIARTKMTPFQKLIHQNDIDDEDPDRVSHNVSDWSTLKRIKTSQYE